MTQRILSRVATSLLCLSATLAAGCSGPSADDRRQLNLGYNDYSDHRYEQAESAANAFIAKYPNDPNVDEAYYLRGLARMGRGNQPLASQDLAEAINISKRDDLKAKAYRALGDISFDAQRWEQAIDYYNDAIKLYPVNFPDPMALYRIGASWQAMGQWGQAKPFFQKAARLTKDEALSQRCSNRVGSTFFALQFGAYGTEANATAEAGRLMGLGVRAEVVPEVGESALLYTVRAGAYPDYASAQEARRQLLPKFPKVLIAP